MMLADIPFTNIVNRVYKLNNLLNWDTFTRCATLFYTVFKASLNRVDTPDIRRPPFDPWPELSLTRSRIMMAIRNVLVIKRDISIAVSSHSEYSLLFSTSARVLSVVSLC